MAKVVLRFSVYTDRDDLDLQSLLINFPSEYAYSQKGSFEMLSTGKRSKVAIKETSATYKTQSDEIFDINHPFNDWKSFWSQYKDGLTALRRLYDIKLLLDFEVTIFDSIAPAIYFEPASIDLMSELGLQLAFYFYFD